MSALCVWQAMRWLTAPLTVEFSNLKQTFNPKDMDVFFQNFSPDQVGQRPTLVSFDGGMVFFVNSTPSA